MAAKILPLHHASLQWSDPNKLTAARDMTVALKRKFPIVSFTEVFDGNERDLERVAKPLGYKLAQAAGNDAICVHEDFKVLDTDATLVNPAQKGKPPVGGHSVRHAAWVQVRWESERIFYVSGHWVTGFGKNPDRTESHNEMSEEIVSLVQEYGQGAKLAFFAGDVNARDTKGIQPGYKILDQGNLTTCWDEEGVWPPTHGHGGTIDVIGSYDLDARVSCVRAKSHKKVESDHRPISAWYEIKDKRR